MKFIKNLLLFATLLVSINTYAEVTLPSMVSSNMVLQRSTEVRIWGWAEANEKVELTFSWITKTATIKANKEGYWEYMVQTTDSKEEQTITLQSKSNEINLTNILFGEVWLCSGQSNMEEPVSGYPGQPVEGSADAIAHATNPNLRLLTVGRNAQKEVQKDVELSLPWTSATPETVASFSATAYFYGSQLQEILDVPVGLICCSWGGSSIQTWMSHETLNPIEPVESIKKSFTKTPHQFPSALYNGMMHPLIPYTIKGVLWYQGESNRHNPDLYTSLLPAMVADWRESRKQGDFPFYYVQIAPYSYRADVPKNYNTTQNTAFMREALHQCNKLIPNSDMAVTMDIGQAKCIHPPYKKEVADRLLYHALSQTYMMKGMVAKSPTYQSITIKDSTIHVKFDDAPKGIFITEESNNFEIAGEDHIFYPAKAKIQNRRELVVHSEFVDTPVAVRYAWKNWTIGTLFNTFGLPVSSFRTDNWKDATQYQAEDKN